MRCASCARGGGRGAGDTKTARAPYVQFQVNGLIVTRDDAARKSTVNDSRDFAVCITGRQSEMVNCGSF